MAIIKKYEDKLEMPKRGKGDHSKGGVDPYFDQRLLEGVSIGLSFKLFLEGFWSFGDQELFFLWDTKKSLTFCLRAGK